MGAHPRLAEMLFRCLEGTLAGDLAWARGRRDPVPKPKGDEHGRHEQSHDHHAVDIKKSGEIHLAPPRFLTRKSYGGR